MVFDKFDFQEEKAVEEIKKRNAKLVLVQLPEGLKQEAVRIANLLEKEADCTVIVSGDSCWGACDVSIDDARNLKVDLIVHFGHAQFIKIDYPIVYIEIQDKTDLKPLLKLASISFAVSFIKNCPKCVIAFAILRLKNLQFGEANTPKKEFIIVFIE